MANSNHLGQLLVKVFADWVNTPSEELLEDGGIVIDHLADYIDRDILDSITEEEWANAWSYFDKTVKRQLEEKEEGK